MNTNLNSISALNKIIDGISLKEYPNAINTLSSFSTQLAMIPQNDVSIASINALWTVSTGILLSSCYNFKITNKVKVRK